MSEYMFDHTRDGWCCNDSKLAKAQNQIYLTVIIIVNLITAVFDMTNRLTDSGMVLFPLGASRNHWRVLAMESLVDVKQAAEWR